MEPDFWHEKWATDDIAFHQSETNPQLIKYIGRLKLGHQARIFVPLCGKTLDIHWLLANGYRVVGSELNEKAVQTLFAELNLEPEIELIDKIKRFHIGNINIYVGDIFELTRDQLGQVDAIYDRAALVALPISMRSRYTAHLINITDNASQLLICYEYDQSLRDKPPFSINEKEVHQHYKNHYTATLLESITLTNFKNTVDAKEHVWLLKKP